jgi:hypothetical protein
MNQDRDEYYRQHKARDYTSDIHNPPDFCLGIIQERGNRKARYHSLTGTNSPKNSGLKSVDLNKLVSKAKGNYNKSTTTKHDEH